MFGLRTRKVISKDLEETTAEIERLTLRVNGLRKEINIADKDPEIQSILDAQPIGPMLRNGTPATPKEVLEERLDTDFVSLHHASNITDTYVHLRASLNVRDRNVSLPSYGDDSMDAAQVMRKLYASETLRELLRYKNDDIGKFIVIDRNGYVSLLR
jgi:hypothetical protein